MFKQPQGQIYIFDHSLNITFQFFDAANVNPNNTYLSIGPDGILRCFDNNLNVILTVSPNPGVIFAMNDNGTSVLYKDSKSQLPVWTNTLTGLSRSDDLYLSSTYVKKPI